MDSKELRENVRAIRMAAIGTQDKVWELVRRHCHDAGEPFDGVYIQEEIEFGYKCICSDMVWLLSNDSDDEDAIACIKAEALRELKHTLHQCIQGDCDGWTKELERAFEIEHIRWMER